MFAPYFSSQLCTNSLEISQQQKDARVVHSLCASLAEQSRADVRGAGAADQMDGARAHVPLHGCEYSRCFAFPRLQWNWDDKRDRHRIATRQMWHQFQWNTMRQDDAAKNAKHVALERVAQACTDHALDYKHFANLLRRARIELTPESLAHLAVWEPSAFKVGCLSFVHNS